MVSEKRCSTCKEVKPADAFSPDKRMRLGLKSQCKKCGEACSRHWRERNPERHQAIRKRASAKWQRENPAKRSQTKKAWRQANLEHALEVERQSRERNALAHRLAQERRRAASEPSADTDAYACIVLVDPCAFCGSRESAQLDHIDPLAAGGVHSWTNLTVLCASCNRAKHTKPLLAALLAREAIQSIIQ